MLIPIVHHNYIAGYDSARHLSISEIVTGVNSGATLTNLVPYTGGSSNVDLGAHNLTVDSNLFFVDAIKNYVGVGAALQTVLGTIFEVFPAGTGRTAGAIRVVDKDVTIGILSGTSNDSTVFSVVGRTGDVQFGVSSIGVGMPGSPVAGVSLNVATRSQSGTTNAYGLKVNAPTAATNNYAASFMGGYVGVGTVTPTVALDVVGDIKGSTTLALGGYLTLTPSAVGQTINAVTSLNILIDSINIPLSISATNIYIGVLGVVDLGVNGTATATTLVSSTTVEAAAASGFKLGSNATIKYDSTSSSIEFNVI